MSLLLALGDSITAGYGVGVNQSFSALYYHRLLAEYPNLGYRNLGINGLDLQGLNKLLSQRGPTSYAYYAAQADIMTITIGSNDLLDFARKIIIRPQNAAVDFKKELYAFLAVFAAQLEMCGQTLRRLNSSNVIEIAAIFNPLPAGLYVQYAVEGQYVIDRVNHLLWSCAKRYNLRLIRVDRVFHGHEKDLIGPDHIHPNQAGHYAMSLVF